jgi:hypothetical protein
MTLDNYEHSLLTELREHVATRAAAPAPRRRARRRWALGAVPAGVATAVGIGLALSGPSGAYAVEEAGNGDVVVTIHRLDDAAGLERALASHGVTADVRYDPTVAPKSDTGRESGTAGSKTDGSGTSSAGDQTDQHSACSIHLAKSDAGLTFTLSAAQVASDARLEIVTGGSAASDVGSPVAVNWSGGAC